MNRMLGWLGVLAACGINGDRILAFEPCRIEVIDEENGWPVPLVELRTTHHVSFISDNAGVIAFDLPELMNVKTWFHVTADGYEVSKDGFGMRGVRLIPKSGARLEVRVKRTSLAKRLGRITGGGIFGESQRFGEHLDWEESGVLGSDSIQIAVHRGRLFWGWGDTVVARYPLGLFHMTSATTEVRPLSKWEPPLKVKLNYFRDESGQVRNVADLHPGEKGPTWIHGYVNLPDRTGMERLVGCYGKVEPPLSFYRIGLCLWDDESDRFDSVRVLWEKSSGAPRPELIPWGHPAFWTGENGKKWLLLGNPLPTIRMPPTYEAYMDPASWEKITPPATLPDRDGNPVRLHSGSIAWNGWRKKWIAIFVEKEGAPSLLGEVWHAEADSPLGPWGKATKILSHRRHSFYNPRIHPEFSSDDSPVLIFEGTYTKSFSSAKNSTPRHEYNQVLYRLDLDELQRATVNNAGAQRAASQAD